MCFFLTQGCSAGFSRTRQVGSFPFLSQLNLRSVINLSAEPLHDKAIDFFQSTDVNVVSKEHATAG